MNKSTDVNWELYGKNDPYFGVLTHPRFRRDAMDAESKAYFFETGVEHVDHVFEMIHTYVDPQFKPRRILDFGCGVGRLVVAFADRADGVVGVDVSPSMLKEAANNCEERGLQNVEWVHSDDDLSGLKGSFNLIHSFIVFQHIPVDRGLQLASRLVDTLEPSGVGALHFTFGQEPPAVTWKDELKRVPLIKWVHGLIRRPKQADPMMEMNPYPLNELYTMLYRKGVKHIHTRMTNHGGHFGVFLFFKKEPIS